ncbi:MAG: hypothetical protein IJX89_04290 [Alphaproteobacteria bacterium]|nr:hypothetical protein [Alphaproteobacteria bacterium]
MPKQTKKVQVVHTTSQRIWGIIALIGLFICGVMLGWGLNSRRAAPVSELEQITAPAPQVTHAGPKSTCAEIEALLLERINEPMNPQYQDTHIYRAKIYANLSERGCPENSEKYVTLAKQELEIARALADDEFADEETIEMVETYKRLNMQAAAQEIFETAKKLTDPAIDFILEVEKIINEQ